MTTSAVAHPGRLARLRASTLAGRGALVLSGCILAVIVVAAIAAPLVAPYDPVAQDPARALANPSWAHPLGTDDLGRDVLSRMVYGARVSFVAAFLAVGVALAIGLPAGFLAGSLGRATDAILMRIIDTMLSFPALVLAIAITGVLGPSLINAMLSVGIVFAPTIARLARAQTLAVREQVFIEAARSFGCGLLRGLLFRHLVPNAIQPVMVQTAMLLGRALLAEASLSFLGLGVQPPEASWGSILARAYTFIGQAPVQIFVPGLAIVLTVLAFNVMSDEIQDLLDPKRRRRRT